MSVAEAYQQGPYTSGPVLTPVEEVAPKPHVGEEEAARLMAVGAFNARILASKIKLETLRQLPYPAYADQDIQLEREITELRAQRDAAIEAGVAAKYMAPDSAPLRLVVPAESPAVEAAEKSDEDGSLPAYIRQLQEAAVAYASLAHKVGSLLGTLSDTPEEESFSWLDQLIETTEQTDKASSWLVAQCDSATDQLSGIEPEQTDEDEAPHPAGEAAAVEPQPEEAQQLAEEPTQPDPEQTIQMLPNYQERLSALLAARSRFRTEDLVFALTGSMDTSPSIVALVEETVSAFIQSGSLLPVSRGQWQSTTAEDGASQKAATALPTDKTFEDKMKGVKKGVSWKPSQRGRGSGKRRGR